MPRAAPHRPLHSQLGSDRRQGMYRPCTYRAMQGRGTDRRHTGRRRRRHLATAMRPATDSHPRGRRCRLHQHSSPARAIRAPARSAPPSGLLPRSRLRSIPLRRPLSRQLLSRLRRRRDTPQWRVQAEFRRHHLPRWAAARAVAGSGVRRSRRTRICSARSGPRFPAGTSRAGKGAAAPGGVH